MWLSAKSKPTLPTTTIQFPKQPFDETDKFIHWAHGNNIHLGLVSSLSRSLLLRDLENAGLPLRLFDSPPDGSPLIYGYEDTPAHKPDGAVFEKPLERLHYARVEPESVLYLGDHLVDYSAAQAAGIGFVAVTTGLHHRADFERAGLPSSRIATNIGSVIPLIQEISLTNSRS